MPLKGQMVGAFTPPLTMDSAGDAFRAWFNLGIPANVSTCYFDIFPDWDSEDFIAEDITWSITGGQPALWTLNPAGYTPKPGGFVLGGSRAAVGGAGTSCQLQGVCSSGRIITVGINLAQYFAVALTAAGQTIEYAPGSTFDISAWCNYGSGNPRVASLYVDEGDGFRMVAQQTANATGTSLLASFSIPYTYNKSCTVFMRIMDNWGRWADTPTARYEVKPVRAIDFFVISNNGTTVEVPLLKYPGADVYRHNLMSARYQDVEIRTTPPSSPNIPGLPVSIALGNGVTAQNVTVAQWPGNDHRYKVTTAANAVSNSLNRQVAVSINGFAAGIDTTVPSPFPGIAATGIDVGTATPGLTVTKTDATNWTVSLSLAAGAKALNVVTIPANAVSLKFNITTIADATIIDVSEGVAASTITPKKVGTTKAVLRNYRSSGDNDVQVNLTVTVTA